MSSVDSSIQIDATESDEASSEEMSKKRFEPYVKLPKWLRIILMFVPAIIIAGIIILIDETVEFPASINPAAIIAIIGFAIFGIVVLGDMVYRNIFVYQMLRREARKSRVYKQILKEREEKTRQQIIEEEDEYEYDDDEVEEDDSETEEYEKEKEYSYDVETERESYRIKSFTIRGGIMSILLVNGLLLLAAAAILQVFLYGGFSPPPE
jgi:hypothetical protein